MTDDYKEIALEFLANWSPTYPEEEHKTFYGGYVGITRIYDDFDNDAIIKCVKQLVSPTNTGITWTVIALYSETLHKGRFVIFDENLEIITTIDEYTSGANIGCFYDFEFDEKGRLYGIEWFNEERVRFIMLNNIAIPKGTTYYAEIRKSYDVPTLNGHAPLQRSYGKAYIVKCLNASKYAIFIYPDRPGLAGEFYSFEINVNDGNTWKEEFIPSFFWQINKPLITYDSNNKFSFKMLELSNDIDTTAMRVNIVENDNGFTSTFDTLYLYTNGKHPLQETKYWWLDNSKILVPFYDDNFDKLYLQSLDIDTETTFTLLYTEDFYTNQLQVIFNDIKGECYMFAVGKNYNAPGTPEEDMLDEEGFKECIYHIFNPYFSTSPISRNYEELVIQEEDNHNLIPDWFGVEYYLIQNQYNLYNHILGIKLQDNGNVIYNDVKQEVYNENNIKSSPSINAFSLDGNEFILMNEYDKILYARNIYNKVQNENIIDYSLYVPNNLCNSQTIKSLQLWSYSKNVLNDESTDVSKNEYEELVFNIHDKLFIYNNNDINNPVRLTDMENKLNEGFITIHNPLWWRMKARVNYTDNTSEIKTLTTTQVGNVVTKTFELEVTKEIESIEYVNYVEDYTYIEVTPELEIGKTYNISQDIRIGE